MEGREREVRIASAKRRWKVERDSGSCEREQSKAQHSCLSPVDGCPYTSYTYLFHHHCAIVELSAHERLLGSRSACHMGEFHVNVPLRVRGIALLAAGNEYL
jgi:hypothetical protein